MIYLVLALIDVFLAVFNYREIPVLSAFLASLSVVLFYMAIEAMIIRIINTGA